MEKDDMKNDIKDMVIKFKQCADATSELSNGIGEFSEVYKKIEVNTDQLKEIESNLNSNKEIKELLEVTDSMKDIFIYFKDNIPTLSEGMKQSKKEIELYTENLKEMFKYFDDLTKKIDRVNLNFQDELLKKIDESIERAVDKKMDIILDNFENVSNNMLESLNRNMDGSDVESIYNIYISNKRQLPLAVQRVSWPRDSYFIVDTIEKSSKLESFKLRSYVAKGRRFKEEKYYEDVSIGADLKQFRDYSSFVEMK